MRPPWGADGSAGIIPAHTDEIAIDSEIRLLRDHHLESRKPDLLLFGGDFVEAQSVPRTTRPARVNRLARLLGKINQKWGTGSASSAPTAVITAREARAQTFVYAAGVVRRIAEEVGLGDRLATRVVVCPGNHDVDRQQSAGDARKNLDDFYTAFADFVTPRSDPPFVKDDSLGICLLPLDTAFLGGAMMGNGQAAHPEDVSIFSLRGIREALAQLMKPRGRTAVPEGHLGIVLSHHPPGSTPTEFPDARAFDTAIAAEQAKDELFRAGFRVFLHGHKHVAVAQTESVRRGNSTSDMIVLGAANYGHQKCGSRGFSVIEYAVSRLCGEARLRVQG